MPWFFSFMIYNDNISIYVISWLKNESHAHANSQVRCSINLIAITMEGWQPFHISIIKYYTIVVNFTILEEYDCTNDTTSPQ